MSKRVRVKTVDVGPLVERVEELADMRLMILNGLRDLRGERLKRLATDGRVHFDIGMLEGVGGISKLIQQISGDRLVFGSHSPMFYLESALLKLRESDLDESSLQALKHKNVARLFNASSEQGSSRTK